MTAYAHPGPQAAGGPARQRELLARKVVSNLFFLREHPLLSPGLRQVMANAHRLWLQQVQHSDDNADGSAEDGASWAARTSPTAH